VAISLLWSSEGIVPFTSVGAAPIIGRIGSSPIAPQPGPARAVSPYPRSWLSPWR
jgi:hypothetical protein